MSAQYYKKSGRVSLPAFLAALIFGGLTAIVLGVVYAYAAFYNPVIYIQFIGTLLFGALVGYVVTKAAIGLKSRNTLMDMLALLIVTGLAIWVYWAYWAHISGYGDRAFISLSLQDKFMAGPLAAWSYAFDPGQGLGNFYGFSIGKRGSNGMGFSGSELHYFWWAEIALIVLSSLAAMLLVNMDSAPYNEKTKRASTLTLKTRGHGFDGDEEGYVSAFEKGDFSALLALSPVPDSIENGATGAEVKLYRDAEDPAFNLLSVEKLTYEIDKDDGKVSSSEDNVITHLYITASQADALGAQLPEPQGDED
jgi:hypothetical protein